MLSSLLMCCAYSFSFCYLCFAPSLVPFLYSYAVHKMFLLPTLCSFPCPLSLFMRCAYFLFYRTNVLARSHAPCFCSYTAHISFPLAIYPHHRTFLCPLFLFMRSAYIF